MVRHGIRRHHKDFQGLKQTPPLWRDLHLFNKLTPSLVYAHFDYTRFVNPVQRNARSVLLTRRIVHNIEPGAARKRNSCPLPLRFPLRVLGLTRLPNQHEEHIDPDVPRAVHAPWQLPQRTTFIIQILSKWLITQTSVRCGLSCC